MVVPLACYFLVALLGIWSRLALVAAAPPQLLVFHKTLDYYHESIPAAVEAIRNMSTSTSAFSVISTDNSSLFTSEGLSQFSGIAFLSNSEALGETSEMVLNQQERTNFHDWLTRGGSLIGLHSGTACLFRDEQFGVAMGSWFDYHPDLQSATFTKLGSHPTIDMLPERYTSVEEVYSFRTDPRAVNATVLLTVDENSYSDPQRGTRPYFQGTPPPIAWLRDASVDLLNGTSSVPSQMSGRLWMTSLGHSTETWRNSVHLSHVQAGILWALQPFLETENSSSSTTSTAEASQFSGRSTTSSGTVGSTNAPAQTGAAATSSTPSAASSLSNRFAPAEPWIWLAAFILCLWHV